jgi:hypothetical protein
MVLASGRIAWCPLILGCGIAWFVLNSYPMMRPGFDVWWHLGMLDAPDQADPTVFSARRIAWHHAWKQVFELLNVDDVFDRALVVHRTQFAMTATLLTLSAYLVLRVLTQQLNIQASAVWMAALFSTVIWFLMHGTYSTARGGGPDSSMVQSWPMWYSVTYQISLPLYFAATACLLYGIASNASLRWRTAALGACICFISISTLAHAAETAYFLVCLLILAPLYVQRQNLTLVALMLPGVAAATYWLAMQQSYAVPPLLVSIMDGGLDTLLAEIHRSGTYLVGSGRNRMDTAWHALHWVSLIGLVIGAAGLFLRHQSAGHRPADLRPFAFLGLTALMPAALAFPWGAGLFAQITHELLAWRFALASFLFVGLPVAALAWVEGVRWPASSGRRQLLVGSIIVLTCGGVLWLSKSQERRHPSFAYAQSMVRSLDPAKSYFGLGSEQRAALSTMAATLRSRQTKDLACTDLFTAYYLFFVEKYRDVHLPSSLEHVPGHQAPSGTDCGFPPSNPYLTSLGLHGIKTGPAP